MAEIRIYTEKIPNLAEILALCPFGALIIENGHPVVTAACKMCRICVKKGPPGAFEFVERKTGDLDVSEWSGIAVYVEHEQGHIHPVTLELIGKAKDLAAKRKEKVYVLFIGSKVAGSAADLLKYGPDEIFVYDAPELEHFRIEPYSAAFSDFIEKQRPAIVLVGGTTIGRSFAPRVAARFKTGLTADCTSLEIQEDGGLAQIRPAFGGNIMAHITTPKRRPQFATVRYKIFPMPRMQEKISGKITVCTIAKEKMASSIEVLSVLPKQQVKGIEEAEVIIAVGRGIKKPEDLEMFKELAALLHGEIAGTRSLIEAGWLDARRQIGLSGRTVKPKIIITCGIAGAIQFVAGMKNSEMIISINTDPEAPIFKVAHYCLIGDLYKIVPELIQKIKSGTDSLNLISTKVK